jgi:predicted PurR-regulated permease PerM
MTELIQKITNYIDSLNTKKRYLLIGIFIGAVFLLHGIIIFWHYSSIQQLTNQIDEINEQREERVQDIVTRTNHVRKQREEVDALLAKDPDFKLGGYINDLLAELRLTNNKESEATSQTEREEKYLETI